jgi:hypothetical protein
MGSGANGVEVLSTVGRNPARARSAGAELRIWFCLHCQARRHHRVAGERLFCFLCGTLCGSYFLTQEIIPGNGSAKLLRPARRWRRSSRRKVKATARLTTAQFKRSPA